MPVAAAAHLIVCEQKPGREVWSNEKQLYASYNACVRWMGGTPGGGVSCTTGGGTMAAGGGMTSGSCATGGGAVMEGLTHTPSPASHSKGGLHTGRVSDPPLVHSLPNVPSAH